MIKNFFKTAWRNLVRHRRMTMINIAGLGIGMAATVLIVLWVQNELSFDKQQPDAANIYRVKAYLTINKTETWVWEHVQYILADHAVKDIPEVENATRLKPNNYAAINMRYRDQVISEKKSAYVDDQWFKMFHYDFIEGSPETFNKNPFSLILTQTTAKKYFGNEEPMGKILKIDTVNYQVEGVVKDAPANSSFQYNMLMPIAAQLTDTNQRKNALVWNNYNYLVFLKLKPGAKPANVSAKLLQILRTNRKDDNGKSKYGLINIRDMHFENDLQSSSFAHGNRTIVNVFIVLASFLLITACINYVNLTTARASIRSKEVSIRKIVGAGRLHLFGQFMSESLLVSLIALVFALLLVQVSLPWFRTFTDRQFDQPFSSPVIILIIGATLLISFLLNGLYPAFLLSSFQPLKVFRGKSVLNFKDSGLRKVLVVVQFTISVILIIGTIVIYSQLRYMQKTDIGYNRAQVFTFNFPYWKIKGFDFKKSDALLKTVKEELKSQSSVSEISLASSGLVDFGNQSSGSFDWAGRPKDFEPSFAPLRVDPDFQHMMQVKVIEGRWFNTSKADEHNVLLNETAVKLLHLPKPLIGQRFMHQGDTGVIVGVVKDFHYKSLHEKIGPMVISNTGGTGFYVKTAPRNAAGAIAATQKVWRRFFPDAPFEYDFLDDSYNNLYKTEQQSSLLITLFASIAIVVSALGLLGLAAFAAEQKVKEIGIRKVLGASMQHIVSLLSMDFIKMVLVASVIAFPIAWWAMNKWLQGFAYKISLSWWIFISAAGTALVIALITVSYQAIKAALANPVKSLRSE
ncbi:ABC transporter permease [Mucilaginibacter sp.]|uniref:ABC transporter permease n=1 Tax=Mucilaginibacter sp. TaxID=1882438 RepID=UPI002CDAD08F|nr:ABC transporter permease [Mucilaginibacter sp.]HTI61810.1 ABC transporter permease [Mucilaginibacter sp.]